MYITQPRGQYQSSVKKNYFMGHIIHTHSSVVTYHVQNGPIGTHPIVTHKSISAHHPNTCLLGHIQQILAYDANPINKPQCVYLRSITISILLTLSRCDNNIINKQICQMYHPSYLTGSCQHIYHIISKVYQHSHYPIHSHSTGRSKARMPWQTMYHPTAMARHRSYLPANSLNHISNKTAF